MKILITGGAGFIGSNLVRRYTNQENEIVIIDNFSHFVIDDNQILFWRNIPCRIKFFRPSQS